MNWTDPQTLWLNVTNLALGIVTLLALLICAGGVAWELMHRGRRAHRMSRMDAELRTVFESAEVGLTMADGGETLPDTQVAPCRK
jgi:hypothetical protein